MYNFSIIDVPTTLEVIADLMAQRGLTPSELADKLREHASTVNQWLSGARPLSDRTIHRLSKVFGVSRTFLRTGEPGEDLPPATDGEHLSLWMLENNLSQKDVADKLGMATSQLNPLLKGARPFTTRFKDLLSERLNIDLSLFDVLDKPDSGEQASAAIASNATVGNLHVRTRQVRFLPHVARAGFAQHLFDDTIYDELYITVREDDRLAKHIDDALVVEINGDSMEPLFYSGYSVLGYLLDPSRWEYLKPETIVAVAFGGEGIVVKQVSINAIMTRGVLVLSSINVSRGILEIPVDRIQSIYVLERIVDGKLFGK